MITVYKLRIRDTDAYSACRIRGATHVCGASKASYLLKPCRLTIRALRKNNKLYVHVILDNMADTKAPFIKVDGIPEGYKQTTPVEPEKRLPSSDIHIELCTEDDAEIIVNPTLPPPFTPF